MIGAMGYSELRDQRTVLASRHGLSLEQVDHLLGRYGSLTTDLFELIADWPQLARPIDGADDYLMVEAVYAVTHEGALHLDDILTRRTHISIETTDRGLRAAHAIASVVGAELGWDAARVEDEIQYYRARVAAEIASQRFPDDDSAGVQRFLTG